MRRISRFVFTTLSMRVHWFSLFDMLRTTQVQALHPLNCSLSGCPTMLFLNMCLIWYLSLSLLLIPIARFIYREWQWRYCIHMDQLLARRNHIWFLLGWTEEACLSVCVYPIEVDWVILIRSNQSPPLCLPRPSLMSILKKTVMTTFRFRKQNKTKWISIDFNMYSKIKTWSLLRLRSSVAKILWIERAFLEYTFLWLLWWSISSLIVPKSIPLKKHYMFVIHWWWQDPWIRLLITCGPIASTTKT